MATIKLSLSPKNDKKTGKSAILMRFVGGRNFIFRAKTGFYIKPENWSAENDAPKKLRSDANGSTEMDELRTQLSDLESRIVNEFNAADKDAVTKEWMIETIDKFHHPEKYTPKEDKPQTLFEYIACFIEQAPQRKDRSTGRVLTTGATNVYKTAFKHLQNFAKSERKRDYEFADINAGFYDRFVSYLHKQSYTTNTTGKLIKELKVILKTAYKAGVHSNTAYVDFHVFVEEVDTVYLSEAELQQIKDADLNKKPEEIKQMIAAQAADFKTDIEKQSEKETWQVYSKTLERVRDWFLLLAWTGSRFSDLEKITQQDINSGVITFRQQKTNNKVVIPIHPVVREIFERYEYNLPAPISNQKFNDYIKIVCLLAGINNPESTTRTEGGIRKTTTRPKWRLVSSHTGRRSFCTNMFKQGMPTLTIMAISGHETEKSFLRYIRVSQEEHARMMQEAWAKYYQKS